MPTGWSLNSLDLRTVGYNIATASGWDSFPGMKLNKFDNGYRHGYFRDNGSRWVYRDRDVIISMGIFPVDPTTGAVVTSADEHLEANIATLAGAMYSPTGDPLPLVKTLPSGLVKTLFVYPRDIAMIEQDGKQLRAVSLVLNAPYPFWHGEIDENPGLSGSFSLTNDGTAPINDMVITFNAAQTLTHVASGATITTEAGGITLDVGAGSNGLTGGDQDEIEVNSPWIMEMVPGSNSFTVDTGSVDIDFYHGYLT